MRKYTKLIILSAVLLGLIALITLAMVFDVDLFLFRNLSIAGIQEKKLSVEELIAKQVIEEANNITAKTELQNSKNSYDVAKEEYENIDESTISIVQEATKEEKYFVEYLWIVLGNYATTNGVDINILTPGATSVVEKDKENETSEEQLDKEEYMEEDISNTNSTLRSGIKITIKGRYANVADFVFDVENDKSPWLKGLKKLYDKSLRFKLDNIKMTYAGDNEIQATFDVLSLSVLK